MRKYKNRIRFESIEIDMEEIEEVLDRYPNLLATDLKTLIAFSADILGRNESGDEFYRSVDDIFEGVQLRECPVWDSKESLKESLERLVSQKVAGKAHRIWGIENSRMKKEDVYLLNYIVDFPGPRYQYEEENEDY